VVAVRFHPGLIIVTLGIIGGSALGEEILTGQPPVPENAKPATEVTSADDGFVDRSHTYFDRKINQVVTWFDDLFGDTTVRDEQKADIRLKWTNDLRAEKGEGLKFQSSLNARVNLPNLEKKLKLVIMNEPGPDAVTPVPTDPGTPAATTPTQPNNLRATHTELRYYLHETKTGYAFLAAGSRLVWLPETFVRTRFLTRRSLVDNTFISPSVTAFWQDPIGFGVTPQLEFGHPFAQRYIFVWANSATVYRNRSGFLWGTEVSLSRIVSPVTAIALAVGASGSTRPGADTDRYNMSPNNYKIYFKYRRRIYRPWLFLELIPETDWRRKDTGGREIVPAFTVRLEINSEGRRALLPVPVIVEEPLPIPLPIPGPDQ
jgi:hypothetical protein